ncbi:TIGR00730 family Rossman fold protein [Corynebacterium jeikeium]|uniref:TIGR00730 family Rossman fold protein n=1 Tax=Corynebacterium jeikeium TaxID=38289 RepID=UPI001E504B7D|nr:TIGR00730 family Rossman fold protein [Corynebacterium jeikeium]
MPSSDIHVSAVVVRNSRGEVLCVRKKGTALFQFPGGKLEFAESSLDAVIREVNEELGISLDAALLVPMGTYRAVAANEAGSDVVADLFYFSDSVEPVAAAEIAECEWVNPSVPNVKLAPLLKDEVFPELIANPVRSVAVFTGASSGRNHTNAFLAEALGAGLAEQGVRMIYGGGKVGLMGAAADACLANGGCVIGVIPQNLVDGEIAHAGLSHLEIVDTMCQRKQRMSDLVDAYVCLPGGAGTLDEFFDAWTAQQLGLHRKPIALFGSSFWAPTVSMLKHMADEGFIRQDDVDTLIVADTVDELLVALNSWAAPCPKWN